ncbi:transposase, partial [Prevotella veroralis]
RRCIEPEAVFGQTKYNKVYKRFRHLGKDKVNMDFAFFAIAFNIGKMCKKNNLKELKAIMEVLLVTFRCSIEVYISYWKPNKSFYMKLAA